MTYFAMMSYLNSPLYSDIGIQSNRKIFFIPLTVRRFVLPKSCDDVKKKRDSCTNKVSDISSKKN